MTKIILIFTFLLADCQTYEKRAGVTHVDKMGVIVVSANWVKDKPKKFDVELRLENEDASRGLLVFVGDMGCARGEEKGVLKPTGSDIRVIDLRPSEKRALILTCVLNTETSGDLIVNIGKVFDNPSLDSHTPGKAIAENIVWRQKPDEGAVLNR